MSLTLAVNRAACVVLGGGQDVGVILEHRAAAGGVDDDRVDVLRPERGHVPPGQLERRLLDARVVMDRAAADLAARDHDLAAVLLEDPGRRRVGLGEHGVGDAAEEQRDPRPLGADRAAGPPAAATTAARASAASPASAARSAAAAGSGPTRSAQSRTPDALQQPGRCQRRLDPAGIREQVVEDQPLEQAPLLAGRGGLLERDLERLDHPAVLDARRTGRLAGPAVQAELEVLAHARRPSPAGRRRRPASGRSGPAGCRSRRTSRRRSGSSPCRARSGRIPGSGDTGSCPRASRGRSPRLGGRRVGGLSWHRLLRRRDLHQVLTLGDGGMESKAGVGGRSSLTIRTFRRGRGQPLPQHCPTVDPADGVRPHGPCTFLHRNPPRIL